MSLFNDVDDWKVFVIGTWIVHFVTFWGWNSFLYLCYKNNWFASMRILGGQQPSEELTRDCIKHCLVNHIVFQPIALYFLYPVFAYCGMSVKGDLPAVGIILRDLLVSVVINDTLFYWGHRTLHHKSIYKYIHKQHHQFKVTIGIACEYAHPIEDALCNVFPVMAGSLLMGSHVVSFWIYLAIALTFTIDQHSGYNFTFSPFNMFSFETGSIRHDFHHSHNVGSYGAVFLFWDKLMGTDKAFNDYQEKLNKDSAKAK